MYDVVYVNVQLHQVPVARRVETRERAAEIARAEARRRGNISRMFLPGSGPTRDCVLIVPRRSSES